jgi:membrane-bound serine protease (ClpP class)
VSALFYTGVILAGIILVALPIYFLNWFILKDKQSKDRGYNSIEEHPEMEGRTGYAKTDLRPTGIAIISDQRIEVTSEGEFINKGETVQVIGFKDGRIVVRKL